MTGPLLSYFLGLLLLFAMTFVSASSCSWSNEGCSKGKECCSGSCDRAHEGTNPRCRHSGLGKPCVFDYHCSSDLVCGKFFNCCSPYWKICLDDADCCQSEHVCRPEEGFIYNRCLFPLLANNSGAATSRSSFPWTVALLPLAASAILWVDGLWRGGSWGSWWVDWLEAGVKLAAASRLRRRRR